MRPPAIGRLVLRLWRLGDRRDEIENDLLDLFERRASERGPAFARRRYIGDALSLYRFRRSPEVIRDAERRRGVHTMTHDILFAFRLFRRHPGLYGVTIAGLAVAIAVSAAMFSVVRAVAFGGEGIPASQDVHRVSLMSPTFTRVTWTSPTLGEWAFEDFTRIRAATTAIDLVGSIRDQARYRASADESEGVPVTYLAVTGDYFGVLGLRAEAGRILLPTDERPQLRHAVVSSGFWKNVMGGDHGRLGGTMLLNGERFTIVGIADRAHSGPSSPRGNPAFWITVTAHQEVFVGERSAEARRTREQVAARLHDPSLTPTDRQRLTAIGSSLSASTAWNPATEVFGRVKPGLSRAQAETEVKAAASARAAETSAKQAPIVVFDPPSQNNRQTMTVAVVLLTIVGLVVALACANVTNVLLASAAGRRREIGTRLAIGASRARILRQLLTETVLLGAAGSAIGLLIAMGLVRTLSRLLTVPLSVDVSPDAAVYASVALLTMVASIVAGFAPARYGYRGDITGALKVDQAAAPLRLPRARLRSLLIGGQAAVSAVLLVLAALLTRSLVDNISMDVGYDVEHLVTLGVSNSGAPVANDYDAHWGPLRDQVLGVPGVTAAAFATVAPFDNSSAPQRLNGIRVERNETSPEYFDAVGLRMLRGRAYTREEMQSAAAVVVISASLARAFWGNDDALGDRMDRVWGTVTDADSAHRAGLHQKLPDARIVGIVEDATIGLQSKNAPTIYLPLAASRTPRLVVRAAASPAALGPTLVDAIQRFDPRQRPRISMPSAGQRRELERPRSLTMLAMAVGAIALGLATIGLFGVTAFVVEQRTHEMSVRRALGASSRQLVELMLRDNLRPVAIGLTIGLLMALGGGRMIQAVLYGTSSRDPLALVAATIVLLVVTALAVLIPARKAGRVDPVQLLKQG